MRVLLIAVELVVLSAITLTVRCWNHDQVFAGRDVYFIDADCYARMSRVRLCREHPGLIVRHHDFENFPEGTVPHTTAPFDYLTVGLSWMTAVFSSNALDLAGAWISPLLALAGGLFLWFWTYRMAFRYRWPALLLYAVSPILVHGTELGRPDHQSLLIILFLLALCGEWNLATKPSRASAILTGAAWGVALWVSLYEPLILLVLVQVLLLLWRFATAQGAQGSLRKEKWVALVTLLAVSAALERRIPSFPFVGNQVVRNWASAIGELQHVPVLSPVWFQWGSIFLLAAPVAFLGYAKFRRSETAGSSQLRVLFCLLGILFLLTMWQARWGYFLIVVLVVILPGVMEAIKSRALIWAVCLLSFWPVASVWDARLWPNEEALAQRQEQKQEAVALRELAGAMRSDETRPFLAPWWLSPELAYWSGQPGVAGSSHESLPGIIATARFFSSTDPEEAASILQQRRAFFVVAYNGERLAQTSQTVLGTPLPPSALCYRLDRVPSQVPAFLQLIRQNGGGKLYQAVNNR